MIFQLDRHEIWFPDPSLAEDDGLLALGGDLRTERLVMAYANGIFPWYSEETPILWYAPKQRFVLLPEELKISKNMRKFIRTSSYTITYDEAFADVIKNCASIPRPNQDDTWITPAMQSAYIELHAKGLASSVEIWHKEQLCGGLYGVICGKRKHIFCGESMFSIQPNTSKLALISLCLSKKFELIDCQIESEHLKSMGAKLISNKDYLNILNT
ncbi:leucyl/phenylalanyl-tRNA--protein transferase [Olivibacter sp. SDN3]|uniref:leucyl/phenylalanyl-tRNA--protein transferase n=1 Tax=Olivibacter sp. SDN3 TaxID=2764720 RepID=UPI001650E601|nr:leucyl/phenylalanyl-tRNA--protein transferase [Olivibacter sp. SDN3]QNL50906.1 leucyl/phenylalanyl-tRNA--protein transferase [Olivibacter sp. SDN3]